MDRSSWAALAATLNLVACTASEPALGTGGALDEADSTGSTSAGSSGGAASGSTGAGCEYPEGAVEPMALESVLWPYSWPEAIAADGSRVPLDLGQAFCDDDPNIDWSPHEVLVFISLPAW